MAKFSFRRRPPRLARGGCASTAPEGAVVGPDSSAIGPGWYDSSWELRRGLIVREGLPADASLHEWLEHQLRADTPVAA